MRSLGATWVLNFDDRSIMISLDWQLCKQDHPIDTVLSGQFDRAIVRGEVAGEKPGKQQRACAHCEQQNRIFSLLDNRDPGPPLSISF